MTLQEINVERQKILKKISEIRGRDVLVIASDLSESGVPTQIDYTDILPVSDLLSSLHNTEIDIILETPGGIGEVVEDIVTQIRSKCHHVGIIIPGWAKSAGTIFAMSGDEILMGPTSALGPIDGQVFSKGRRYSADAFLKGLKKIQEETNATGSLNKAYIPILSQISPGEIQSYHNIQNFSKELVTRWLEKYKFQDWKTHRNGKTVTSEERHKRAEKIARDLRNQTIWKTHGRSIKLNDLANLKIKITDFSQNTNLNDAITRYHALMRMTFENSPIYKIFETSHDEWIFRLKGQPKNNPAVGDNALVDLTCPKCKNKFKLQVNFKQGIPYTPGSIPYPVKDDLLKCPKCDHKSNVGKLREQWESQVGKKVVE